MVGRGGGVDGAALVASPKLAHLAAGYDVQYRRLAQWPMKHLHQMLDGFGIDRLDLGVIKHNIGEAEATAILTIGQWLGILGDGRAAQVTAGTALHATRAEFAWGRNRK